MTGSNRVFVGYRDERRAGDEAVPWLVDAGVPRYQRREQRSAVVSSALRLPTRA